MNNNDQYQEHRLIEKATKDIAEDKIKAISRNGFYPVSRAWGKGVRQVFFLGIAYAIRNQWIDIKEAKPEEDQAVLQLTEKGRICIVRYHEQMVMSTSMGNVTHWMPLPELPNDQPF